MGKRLITKAELAREAGISRAAIGKLCKSKPEGKLYPAMDGKLIDLDHTLVVEYLKSKQSGKTSVGVKNTKSAKPTKSNSGKKTTTNSSDVTKDKTSDEKIQDKKNSHYSKDKAVQKVLDWTLREVIKEFGTDIKFEMWAKAVKIISDTRWKDIKTAELEESLIPRDMVETHIFGAIENSHLRLLTDSPKTLARRIFALAKSGDTIQNAEILVRELLSIQLKDSKTTAKKLLKGRANAA